MATDELVAEINASVEASEEAPDADVELAFDERAVDPSGWLKKKMSPYLSGDAEHGGDRSFHGQPYRGSDQFAYS